MLHLITTSIDDPPAQCSPVEVAHAPSCVFGVHFLPPCNIAEVRMSILNEIDPCVISTEPHHHDEPSLIFANKWVNVVSTVSQ